MARAKRGSEIVQFNAALDAYRKDHKERTGKMITRDKATRVIVLEHVAGRTPAPSLRDKVEDLERRTTALESLYVIVSDSAQ